MLCLLLIYNALALVRKIMVFLVLETLNLGKLGWEVESLAIHLFLTRLISDVPHVTVKLCQKLDKMLNIMSILPMS
jgi:hypothetical protein